MPNWCANELHIIGSSEDIKRFMEKSTGMPALYPITEREKEHGYTHPTEPRFCFNALVPTPPEVLEAGYSPNFGQKEKGLNGYDWNCKNWGTKWDIYHDNITLESCEWKEGDPELVMFFLTAWAPPINWLKKVAAMFPNLRFKMHYEEPGCCFAGDICCEGEMVSLNRYSEEECLALFGYDEDEGPEC